MNVVFRVDASVQIGSGHVMRCLTLAHQLKEKGIHSTFISRDLPGNMNAYIAKQFPVVELPTIADEDAWQWTAQHWQQDAKETIVVLEDKVKLVIVDHYSIDEKWQQMLRPYTKKIMVIDDLANRKHDCDILLDQNYYLDMATRYIGLVPKHAKQLLGPKHALLREEFIEARGNIKPFNGKVERLFVFFGGSDPMNETEKVLRAIIPLIEQYEFQVDVVVGNSNPNKQNIEALCLLHESIHYHCQINNMAQLMAQADMAIGAGGATTWERFYLQLPTVAIALADNQVDSMHTLENKGVLIYLGESYQVSGTQIQATLREICLNPQVLTNLLSKAKKLFE